MGIKAVSNRIAAMKLELDFIKADVLQHKFASAYSRIDRLDNLSDDLHKAIFKMSKED